MIQVRKRGDGGEWVDGPTVDADSVIGRAYAAKAKAEPGRVRIRPVGAAPSPKAGKAPAVAAIYQPQDTEVDGA